MTAESPLAARLSGGSGMFAPREAAEVSAAAQQVERERNEHPERFNEHGARHRSDFGRRAQEPRPNSYAGSCVTCGERVEAGAGVLGEKVDGKWTVAHAEGQCPEVQQALPIEEPAVEAGPRRTAPEMQPGIYTIQTAAGHRTFRVYLHREDSDFAPGSTTLEFLSGPDNEKDYTGFAFVKGGRFIPWKRFREGGSNYSAALLADAEQFMADPSAAEAALHCMRCRSLLSVPLSIQRGMGPTCYSKGW